MRERLVRALEHHGRHIERYLSYYFSPNTHLTGEALGLLYIGHVIPVSRFARRCRDLGAYILESWLEEQVYDDGVYFEQSTQYQRYTAEIYLHYLRISESNGRATPPTIRASLSRQFDVLRAIAAGCGNMPLIGDDDGGALFPIDQRSPEDLRGLLLAGATALNRPELVPPGQMHPAMSYWLCGVGATKKMMAATETSPHACTRYFADGGLAVIRDSWRVNSAVAVSSTLDTRTPTRCRALWLSASNRYSSIAAPSPTWARSEMNFDHRRRTIRWNSTANPRWNRSGHFSGAHGLAVPRPQSATAVK